MSTVLMKNQMNRATASLRTAKLLAMAAALVQSCLLLPAQWIVAYKLFPLVMIFSGVLGIIAFRITHHEAGQTIGTLRGLDSLGTSSRSARRQLELSLGLIVYLGFFVPVFNLVLIAWTFLKAHSTVKRIQEQWQQHTQRELRAARLRSG